MGTITGAAGGVFRDVFMNQVPLIFRGEIYALACIFGGISYFICTALGLSSVAAGLICGGIVIATRILAVRYRLHLPILRGETEQS